MGKAEGAHTSAVCTALAVKPFRGHEEYDRLLSSTRGWTLYHTPEWQDFLDEVVKGKRLILGIYHSRKLIGFMPAREVKIGPFRLLGSPLPGWNTPYMGPVLLQDVDPSGFLWSLSCFQSRYRYDHMELVSLNSRFEHDRGWKAEITQTRVSPLATDPVQLLRCFSKSCRKLVRRGQRCGVTVELTTSKEFVDIYYSQLREVFAKHNMVPTYPKERMLALWEHLKHTGRLLTSWAKVGGTIIATRIDMVGNGRLHSFGSASRQDSLHYYPNELLRCFVMAYAGQRQLTDYDMSGGNTYKAKFNAELVDMVRYIRSPNYLRALRTLARTWVYWRKGNALNWRYGRTPTKC